MAAYQDLVATSSAVCSKLEGLLKESDPTIERVKESIENLTAACTSFVSDSGDQLQCVLNALCLVDDEVARALRKMAQCAKLSQELCKLIRELAEAGARLQARMEDWEILAEYSDYVAAFRDLAVRELQKEYDLPRGWDQVACLLATEMGLPVMEQQITAALQYVLLQHMGGVTWQDWCTLRAVCDASIDVMHKGNCNSLVIAHTKINSQRFPDKLQHVREAVKKALDYLSKNPQTLKKKKT